MNFSALVFAIIFLTGGVLNLFFTEFAIQCCRDFSSIVRSGKTASDPFSEPDILRATGCVFLVIGTGLFIVWLRSL